MWTDEQDATLTGQLERLLDGEREHGLDPALATFALELRGAALKPDAAFASRLNAILNTQLQAEKGKIMPNRNRRVLVKVGLALAATLILVTIVYAVDELLQRAINNDPGLQGVNDAELGTPLNLSQTIDELTIELQWVYADHNRVSLGLIMKGDGPLGSPAANYYLAQGVLTDSSGHVFEVAGGHGYTGEGGEGAQVLSFDVSKLESVPDILDLRFETSLEIMTETTYATLQAAPTLSGNRVMTAVPKDQDPFEGPYGPYVFEFQVPTGEKQVMEINQTATDQDVAIRLERLEISPSQTRLHLCFTPPEGRNSWAVIPHLRINGSDILHENPSITMGEDVQPDGECRILIANGALGERTGEWVLEISELVGFGDTGGDQTRIPGEWVFTFAVGE